MVLSSQGFVHKRHLKYQNVFTLAPNSTRFAKFCTDLATNISVLAAIGDGESVRENWAQVKQYKVSTLLLKLLTFLEMI